MSSTQVSIFTQRTYSVELRRCAADDWSSPIQCEDKAFAFARGRQMSAASGYEFRVVENVFNRFVVEE